MTDLLFIVLILIFAIIGLTVIVAADEWQWSHDHKMIFATAVLGILAVICLHGSIQYESLNKEAEMPSRSADYTEVDALLDEVRTDNKTIYFDDEFQILVYKYLLKYTREGKYETVNNPEMDDILRKAKEAIVHDKGRETLPAADD